MKFRTHLLGKSSHEALVHLQEREIALLENIKNFMAQRAKCDQDYAAALASDCCQGLKMNSEILSMAQFPFAMVRKWNRNANINN